MRPAWHGGGRRRLPAASFEPGSGRASAPTRGLPRRRANVRAASRCRSLARDASRRLRQPRPGRPASVKSGRGGPKGTLFRPIHGFVSRAKSAAAGCTRRHITRLVGALRAPQGQKANCFMITVVIPRHFWINCASVQASTGFRFADDGIMVADMSLRSLVTVSRQSLRSR